MKKASMKFEMFIHGESLIFKQQAHSRHVAALYSRRACRGAGGSRFLQIQIALVGVALTCGALACGGRRRNRSRRHLFAEDQYDQLHDRHDEYRDRQECHAYAADLQGDVLSGDPVHGLSAAEDNRIDGVERADYGRPFLGESGPEAGNGAGDHHCGEDAIRVGELLHLTECKGDSCDLDHRKKQGDHQQQRGERGEKGDEANRCEVALLEVCVLRIHDLLLLF